MSIIGFDPPRALSYARRVLRLIAFAALGSLLGGLLLAFIDPSGSGMAIAGISLTVFVLAFTFTRIAGSMSGVVTASPTTVQQARDARRLGLARVDALRQTGTQINDQPLCDIDLTVRPLSGQAWATTIRTIVPLADIPRFQPGTRVEVAVLIEGGPEVAFVDGELSPFERDRLSVPDRSSVPFVPIEKHTRIVDGTRKGPLLGVGRRGRPVRLVLFALVTVAAAAAVVYPYQEAVEQTVDAVQKGELRPDLRQPAVLSQAQQSLQEAIGHDRIVSVFVSKDYVIVEAPIAPGDIKTDRWTYRGGRVDHEGAAPSQPRLAEEQMSWSDISLDQLWPLMESAAAEVALPVGDTTAYVARSTDSNIDSPTFGQSVAAPTISFSIGDDYGSTSFQYTGDGTRIED